MSNQIKIVPYSQQYDEEIKELHTKENPTTMQIRSWQWLLLFYKEHGILSLAYIFIVFQIFKWILNIFFPLNAYLSFIAFSFVVYFGLLTFLSQTLNNQVVQFTKATVQNDLQDIKTNYCSDPDQNFWVALDQNGKIEKTKFGKNLLDMIQLQLSTSDGIDQLVSELQNLDADLVKEQNDDSSEHERVETECEEERLRLSSEIEDAQNRSAELQSEVDAKVPVRDQKQIQLADLQQLLKEYQQNVVDLDNQKEQLDQIWAVVQDDHQKATYTIQRAKDVLVGEFQKGSFLQKKDINFVQLSKHFGDSAKHNTFQKKSWNKIFKLLSQITASAPVQADSGAIAKIIELCDELLAKLDESLFQERQNYNHQVSVYNEQRSSVLEHIQDTTLRIDNLTAEIHTLGQRIEQCQTEKASQDQRAVEKQDELDKRNIYCHDQSEQYHFRTEQRTSQLDVVRQVLDIINSQLRVLKKYVGERGE